MEFKALCPVKNHSKCLIDLGEDQLLCAELLTTTDEILYTSVLSSLNRDKFARAHFGVKTC